MTHLTTSLRQTSTRLLAAGTLCCAFALSTAAQAKPDHTANHIAKTEQRQANAAAKAQGKAIRRATLSRSDADKVFDALTEPEKKVFRNMSSAEKSVAHRMTHIGRQIF